jgi:hypothetical protein
VRDQRLRHARAVLLHGAVLPSMSVNRNVAALVARGMSAQYGFGMEESSSLGRTRAPILRTVTGSCNTGGHRDAAAIKPCSSVCLHIGGRARKPRPASHCGVHASFLCQFFAARE